MQKLINLYFFTQSVINPTCFDLDQHQGVTGHQGNTNKHLRFIINTLTFVHKIQIL
jgi:hypothetical protein